MVAVPLCAIFGMKNEITISEFPLTVDFTDPIPKLVESGPNRLTDTSADTLDDEDTTALTYPRPPFVNDVTGFPCWSEGVTEIIVKEPPATEKGEEHLSVVLPSVDVAIILYVPEV